MIKNLLAVLLGFGCVCMAQAQTRSFTCGQTATSSIVRSAGEYIVVYNHSATINGFDVIKSDRTVGRYMSLDPSWSVTDMEVDGNTVYFCGTHATMSGSTSYVGSFGLLSVATNSSVSVSYSDIGSEYSPKRLAVFQVGTTPHVAIVGDLLNPATQEYIYAGYVMDLNWGSRSFVDSKFYNWVETCDDVAVTDDYVVVVSIKGGGDQSVKFRRFKRPTQLSTDDYFLQTPLYRDTLYDISVGGVTQSSAVVAASLGNRIGIGSYVKEGLERYGMEVHSVNLDGQVSTVKTQFDTITDFSAMLDLQEMRFDNVGRRFLVNHRIRLQELSLPNVISTTCWYSDRGPSSYGATRVTNQANAYI